MHGTYVYTCVPFCLPFSNIHCYVMNNSPSLKTCSSLKSQDLWMWTDSGKGLCRCNHIKMFLLRETLTYCDWCHSKGNLGKRYTERRPCGNWGKRWEGYSCKPGLIKTACQPASQPAGLAGGKRAFSPLGVTEALLNLSFGSAEYWQNNYWL